MACLGAGWSILAWPWGCVAAAGVAAHRASVQQYGSAICDVSVSCHQEAVVPTLFSQGRLLVLLLPVGLVLAQSSCDKGTLTRLHGTAVSSESCGTACGRP